ncbi:MAG: hypothetical protein R2824_09915 [Saprospiraceae bacterium]
MKRWVYLISIIIISMSWGCKNSQVQQSGMLPKSGTILSYDEIDNLKFQWDTSPQMRSISPDNLKLRLYRFEKATSQLQEGQYRFKLIEEQTAGKEGAFVVKKSILAPDESYVWEVISEQSEGGFTPIKKPSVFAVQKEKRMNLNIVSQVLNSACDNCKREPDNCQDLICEFPCPPEPSYYIHIAFLESFDILSSSQSLTLRTDDIEMMESDTCIKSDEDLVTLDANFVVQVPCDKVEPGKYFPSSNIKVYLYKEEELVQDSLALQLTLNDDSESPSDSVLIKANDYLHYCNDENLVCKAKVQLQLTFIPHKDSNGQFFNYTLVFYLPENEQHSHIYDKYSNLGYKVAQDEDHDNPCPLQDYLGAPPLSYYRCMDNDNTHHISKHVCLLPLPICAETNE